jgi:hypothetical protein
MNAVARKAAIAGPMLTCLVLSAMSGPAAAGGSRVDAIARATGVTPSEVQMVLGPRTPHPEYFTSFDRAQRRMIQDAAKPGPAKTAEEVAADIRKRDERDRGRATSPLVPAPDAVILDSSNLTIEEAVERAIEIVAAKLREVAADSAPRR